MAQQLSQLRHTRTLVLASAWSVAILAIITVSAATLCLLREQRGTRPRILGTLWKVQAASAAVLLVAQSAALGLGASTLADTPDSARIFTSIKAFDSPFTDVGNLYYLAWFVATSAAAAALTRILHRSL
ncbi:hypothetical protein [Couchioplanes azureus]|uniref:hypothetical protein n=1 Tax=Couchioplanes caeruleus TaxID=56438 RepID=UPI001670B205|nr:hypothetical protein [Couchioplanes caeruleus]